MENLTIDIDTWDNNPNYRMRWMCGSDISLMVMLCKEATKENNEYIVDIPQDFKSWRSYIGNERGTVMQKLRFYANKGILHRVSTNRFILDKKYFMEYKRVSNNIGEDIL